MDNGGHSTESHDFGGPDMGHHRAQYISQGEKNESLHIAISYRDTQ